MRLLAHQINSDHREYYIKVNNALLRGINVLERGASFLGTLIALIQIIREVRKYPAPTLENLGEPRAIWLLKTLHKYQSYEKNPRIRGVVTLIVTVAIIKINHSAPYKDRASWWVEELPKEWKGRSLNHPVNDWGEEKPYGGRW